LQEVGEKHANEGRLAVWVKRGQMDSLGRKTLRRTAISVRVEVRQEGIARTADGGQAHDARGFCFLPGRAAAQNPPPARLEKMGFRKEADVGEEVVR